MLYEIKKLINRFKNLYFWFKVVWNDSHHDYTSIYPILRNKLELLYNNQKDAPFIDQDKKMKKLLITIEYLKRLENDDFYRFERDNTNFDDMFIKLPDGNYEMKPLSLKESAFINIEQKIQEDIENNFFKNFEKFHKHWWI